MSAVVDAVKTVVTGTWKGGSGNDSKTFVHLWGKMYGYGGNDTLKAYGGRMEVYGGSGNDKLTAGAASGYLDGGTGNDTLNIYGAHGSAVGGIGHDTFNIRALYAKANGDSGDDRFSIFAAYAKVDGGWGKDKIYIYSLGTKAKGGYGDDYFHIGAAGAFVDGGYGNDTINIAAAGAYVRGGYGNDTLNVLVAGGSIHGDGGNDTINIKAVGAAVFGDSGNDAIHIWATGAHVNAGSGNDSIYIRATGANINAGSGNDSVYVHAIGANINMGYGDDYAFVYVAGANIDMGYGRNTVRAFGVGFRVDTDGYYDDDISTIAGGAYIDSGEGGNDKINALGGVNIILAGHGSNNINAVGGANVVQSGNGNSNVKLGGAANVLLIGNGSHTIKAIGGANFVWTGTGDNNIDMAGGANISITGDGNDNITLAGGLNIALAGGGNNTLKTIAGGNLITATDGDDTVYTAGIGNVALLGDGNNELWGLGGGNLVITGTGDDKIHVGGVYANGVVAGDGNNRVVALGQYNILWTGEGNDTILSGGIGNFILAGDGHNTLGVVASTNIAVAAGGDDIGVFIGATNVALFGGGNNFIVAAGQTNVLQASKGNDIMLAGGQTNVLLMGDGNNIGVVGGQYNVIYGGKGVDIQVAGGQYNLLLAGDGPPEEEAAAEGKPQFAHGGSKIREFADKYVSKVTDLAGEYNPFDNVQVAGGQYNLAVSGSGKDMVVLGGEYNIAVSASGDDVAVLGGKLNAAVTGAGEDFIAMGGKTNVALGGSENDVILSGGKNNILFGEHGTDTLVGGGKNNYLFGGSNSDILLAGGKTNVLVGGTGMSEEEIAEATADGKNPMTGDYMFAAGAYNYVIGDNEFTIDAKTALWLADVDPLQRTISDLPYYEAAIIDKGTRIRQGLEQWNTVTDTLETYDETVEENVYRVFTKAMKTITEFDKSLGLPSKEQIKGLLDAIDAFDGKIDQTQQAVRDLVDRIEAEIATSPQKANQLLDQMKAKVKDLQDNVDAIQKDINDLATDLPDNAIGDYLSNLVTDFQAKINGSQQSVNQSINQFSKNVTDVVTKGGEISREILEDAQYQIDRIQDHIDSGQTGYHVLRDLVDAIEKANSTPEGEDKPFEKVGLPGDSQIVGLKNSIAAFDGRVDALQEQIGDVAESIVKLIESGRGDEVPALVNQLQAAATSASAEIDSIQQNITGLMEEVDANQFSRFVADIAAAQAKIDAVQTKMASGVDQFVADVNQTIADGGSSISDRPITILNHDIDYAQSKVDSIHGNIDMARSLSDDTLYEYALEAHGHMAAVYDDVFGPISLFYDGLNNKINETVIPIRYNGAEELAKDPELADSIYVQIYDRIPGLDFKDLDIDFEIRDKLPEIDWGSYLEDDEEDSDVSVDEDSNVIVGVTDPNLGMGEESWARNLEFYGLGSEYPGGTELPETKSTASAHFKGAMNFKFPELEFSKPETGDWVLEEFILKQYDWDIPTIPDLKIPDVNYKYGKLTAYVTPEIDLPEISTPEIQLPQISLPALSLPKFEDFDIGMDGLEADVAVHLQQTFNMTPYWPNNPFQYFDNFPGTPWGAWLGAVIGSEKGGGVGAAIGALSGAIAGGVAQETIEVLGNEMKFVLTELPLIFIGGGIGFGLRLQDLNDDVGVATGYRNYISLGARNDIGVALGYQNHLYGGTDNDALLMLGVENVGFGETGNDSLLGIGGDNYGSGGDGEDRLIFIGGSNTIFGGRGKDLALLMGGNNTALGDEGDDILVAFGAENWLGMDYLHGTPMTYHELGDDTFVAVGSANMIYGGDGEDLAISLGKFNLVQGGDHDDIMITIGEFNSVYGDEYSVGAIGDGNIDINAGFETNQLLFAAESANEGDFGKLDDEIISSKIQSEFAKNDIKDLADAEVKVIEKNSEWEITTDNDVYRLKLEEDTLNIYDKWDIGGEVGLSYAKDGADHIGDDIIVAMGSQNRVEAHRGDDIVLAAGNENDISLGKDLFPSGTDADFGFAVGSSNKLSFGAHNDIAIAIGTDNNIDLGAGDDTNISVGLDNNTVNGGAGEDFIVTFGATGEIDAGANNDIIWGVGWAQFESTIWEDMLGDYAYAFDAIDLGLRATGDSVLESFEDLINFDGEQIQRGGDGDDFLVAGIAESTLADGGAGNDSYLYFLDSGSYTVKDVAGKGNDSLHIKTNPIQGLINLDESNLFLTDNADGTTSLNVLVSDEVGALSSIGEITLDGFDDSDTITIDGGNGIVDMAISEIREYWDGVEDDIEEFTGYDFDLGDAIEEGVRDAINLVVNNGISGDEDASFMDIVNAGFDGVVTELEDDFNSLRENAEQVLAGLA